MAVTRKIRRTQTIMIKDIQIAQHQKGSYKFTIPPKYIRRGDLTLEATYEVGCFTGGRGAVFLKNRRILVKTIVKNGNTYTEYRISIPKSFVVHGLFLLGVDYTLELF